MLLYWVRTSLIYFLTHLPVEEFRLSERETFSNTKKNAGAVLVVSKEVCLEMNAEKTKCTYMFMYYQQNTRQNYSMKILGKFIKTWQMQIFLNDTNKSKLYV